ncbi:hypothetical protein [Edaphobacter aggregans]|uniref:hypothetical protein n=1 Tax=Edaphobacter aggregans TaxID=570835 RepID=UPI0021AD83D0|nr:hypothetical protein [Edaphobacter aggregans]
MIPLGRIRHRHTGLRLTVEIQALRSEDKSGELVEGSICSCGWFSAGGYDTGRRCGPVLEAGDFGCDDKETSDQIEIDRFLEKFFEDGKQVLY